MQIGVAKEMQVVMRRYEAALLAGIMAVTGCGQATPSGPGAGVPAPASAASSTRAYTPATAASMATGPCAGSPSQPSQLQPGAQSVRLCDASSPGLERFAPQDLLTTKTDAVVAAYNALPGNTGQEVCTTEISGTYRLEIRYSDQTVTIDGQAFGCHQVGAKLGADAVLAAFSQALQEQRTTTRPASPAQLQAACHAGWVPARVDDTTGGWVCTGAGELVGEISAADWSVISEDLRRNLRPGAPSASCSAGTGLPPSLWLRDGYGSVRELQWQCGWVSTGANHKTEIWTPGPQADAVMKDWLTKAQKVR